MILKNGKESKYHQWFPENEKIARMLFLLHSHYKGDDIWDESIIYWEDDVKQLIGDILKGKYNDKTGNKSKVKRTGNRKHKLLPKKDVQKR